MDECPICTEPLSGNIATLGCCSKLMHVECLVKCMKVRLTCPMCRANHESLNIVQNTETTVFVNSPPKNTTLFRNAFMFMALTSTIIVSCFH